jgi:cellulose synthase/poly-beta-1,6-N-acetylglucosamine synthase-like glycosyltransferase
MDFSSLEIIFCSCFFLLLILYLYMLYILSNGFKNNPVIENKYLPRVSVIVSMHNEQENVVSCVDHLLAQDYPSEKFEIILVDDRSTDKTLDKIQTYTGQYPHIKVISITDRLLELAPKKRAIDTAVRMAGGEIILFTDADGRPQSGWVTQMISYFNEDIGMVIGYAPYTTAAPQDGIVHKLLALEYFTHAAVAAASSGIGIPVTCVGTNMAYRKHVYLQLGGFGKYKNYPSGDDDLFLQRVRDETKWNISYAGAPDTHVYNDPPDNWKKFYNQRLRYASKGFFYNWKLISVLVAFYLLNLQFISFPFLAFWNLKMLLLFVLAIVMKNTGELLFLKRAANYLNDKRHLLYYTLAFLLHPPYVVYFGVMSQVQKFKWAD